MEKVAQSDGGINYRLNSRLVSRLDPFARMSPKQCQAKQLVLCELLLKGTDNDATSLLTSDPSFTGDGVLLLVAGL